MADCALVGFVIEDALRSVSFTPGGSLSEQLERASAVSFCVVDRALTTATTYASETVTGSGTGDYIGIAFALAPTAGGGGTPLAESDWTASSPMTAPNVISLWG